MKNKFTTIIIILATILLAGIAIFTAIKLYQTRNVAPTKSEAGSAPSVCQLSFTITGTTATPTATATATATGLRTATPTATATATATGLRTATPTATATATATANPECNNSCTQNTDCLDGLMCYITSGATSGSCRNTSCLSETDCLCPQATMTATSVAQGPTDEPQLPNAGTSWPTVLGTVFGILVILGSLLLAF